MVVAVSVGAAIVLGVLRILKGWPIHRLIIGGYVLVTVMTAFAPDEIIGVAYDSGGVTTSTITVPLVTALGVGLASSIKGRKLRFPCLSQLMSVVRRLPTMGGLGRKFLHKLPHIEVLRNLESLFILWIQTDIHFLASTT